MGLRAGVGALKVGRKDQESLSSCYILRPCCLEDGAELQVGRGACPHVPDECAPWSTGEQPPAPVPTPSMCPMRLISHCAPRHPTWHPPVPCTLCCPAGPVSGHPQSLRTRRSALPGLGSVWAWAWPSAIGAASFPATGSPLQPPRWSKLVWFLFSLQPAHKEQRPVSLTLQSLKVQALKRRRFFCSIHPQLSNWISTAIVILFLLLIAIIEALSLLRLPVWELPSDVNELCKCLRRLGVGFCGPRGWRRGKNALWPLRTHTPLPPDLNAPRTAAPHCPRCLPVSSFLSHSAAECRALDAKCCFLGILLLNCFLSLPVGTHVRQPNSLPWGTRGTLGKIRCS